MADVKGLTEVQVNELKSKYGELFMINLGDDQFVYRPIKRHEYKIVVNTPESNRAFNEEKIVQMCVVHPPIDVSKLPGMKAGTVSTLVELIMAASNFGITEEPIKL